MVYNLVTVLSINATTNYVTVNDPSPSPSPPPTHTLSTQDMRKHSSNAPKACADLKIALDRMLKVLKNLNDSLHVVGLKGFPVSKQ